MPGAQDVLRQGQRVAGKSTCLRGPAQHLAPISQRARSDAVGRLEFGTRPERRGQRESGKCLIRHSACEHWLDFVQTAGDFALVSSFDDQPERFALLVEMLFDGFERGIRLTVARPKCVGGRVHCGKTKKQRRQREQNQNGCGGEDLFCANRIERLDCFRFVA